MRYMTITMTQITLTGGRTDAAKLLRYTLSNYGYSLFMLSVIIHVITESVQNSCSYNIKTIFVVAKLLFNSKCNSPNVTNNCLCADSQLGH